MLLGLPETVPTHDYVGQLLDTDGTVLLCLHAWGHHGHCGAVRWRFEGVPISATSCNCSICRRHGALWAYGFEGEAISVSGETGTYVWNNKALAFHFCGRCACVVAWLATSRGDDGRLYGAVNLRLAVEPEAVAAVPIVHHDSETMSDLPRGGRCVADVWF